MLPATTVAAMPEVTYTDLYNLFAFIAELQGVAVPALAPAAGADLSFDRGLFVISYEVGQGRECGRESVVGKVWWWELGLGWGFGGRKSYLRPLRSCKEWPSPNVTSAAELATSCWGRGQQGLSDVCVFLR